MEQLSPCIAVTCCLQTRYIYLPKLRTLTLFLEKGHQLLVHHSNLQQRTMRSEKALQCCGLVPVHGISFIYRVDLSLLWDLQAI
jgi:hypothetical protein